MLAARSFHLRRQEAYLQDLVASHNANKPVILRILALLISVSLWSLDSHRRPPRPPRLEIISGFVGRFGALRGTTFCWG